ncbi:PPE family protein, SVP subgroup [Mycobacterium kiyosense]
MNSVAFFFQDTLFVGDETAGFAKLGSVANDIGSAAQAAEAAAQAATAAVPKLSSSVGGVAAGLGRAVPLSSGLSVPVSWTSATAQAGSGVTAISNATSISAAAEGAVGSNVPVAPPFGQFVNAGNGRRTPAYGQRLTFMTRPPAAG